MKESLSVTIPAYNEEQNVTSVVKNIKKALKKINLPYEIVLVDDGSTDNTGLFMDSLEKKDKFIKVVHHKKNKGFTGAISTCLKSAKKSLIFLGPCDNQFDFRDLNRFIIAIKNYDAAIAYRIKNPEPFSRKFQSWFFHKLCRLFLNIKLKEISTVSLWRKSAIKKVSVSQSQNSGAMFLPELIYKLSKKNCRFVEVPITWKLRKNSKPKGSLNPRLIYHTFRDLLKIWWNK